MGGFPRPQCQEPGKPLRPQKYSRSHIPNPVMDQGSHCYPPRRGAKGYYPWPQQILRGLYPSRGLLFYTNGLNYRNSITFLIRTPVLSEKTSNVLAHLLSYLLHLMFVALWRKLVICRCPYGSAGAENGALLFPLHCSSVKHHRRISPVVELVSIVWVMSI